MMRWVVPLWFALSLSACSAGTEEVAETASPERSAGVARSVAPDVRPSFKVAEAFAVGRGVYVRALARQPDSRTMWIGTSVGALEIDGQTREVRQTYTRSAGLANEYVFAIFPARDGGVWFGTNGGGMSRLRDGQWRTYFPMHGLADYWVYSFGQQRDGTLWVGTWAGVTRKAAGSEAMHNYVEELVNEWVYSIAVDGEDRVWFGTEGGVSMFDGRQWRSWTHADGVGAPNRHGRPPSTNTGLGTRMRHDLTVTDNGQETYNPGYVFAILAARDGSIWVGTWGGGASRFHQGQWESLTTEDGLAGDIVYSIAQDDTGALWFGTNHGVSRYDGRQWVTLSRKDGLMDDNVYALANGFARDIWVGTKNGVARIVLEAGL